MAKFLRKYNCAVLLATVKVDQLAGHVIGFVTNAVQTTCGTVNEQGVTKAQAKAIVESVFKQTVDAAG